MTRFLLTSACLLFVSAHCVAQDTIRLKSRKLIKGEIKSEAEDGVKIIDRMGEIRIVKTADIANIRRGRPLSSKVRDRLGETGEPTADAMWAVAVWAIETKMQKDAERLARRVLALEPEHAAARELLGHKFAVGTWYPNAQAASDAVKDQMKQEGRVLVASAWAMPVDKDAIKDRPKDWMVVDGMRWRLIRDVMSERGAVLWRDCWYEREEATLVPVLRGLTDLLKVDVHGARAPSSLEVIGAFSRDEAKNHLAVLKKSKKWFADTFDAHDHSRVKNDVFSIYVLPDQAGFETFCRHYQRELRFDSAWLEICLPLGAFSWDAGHATHLQSSLWNRSIAKRVADGLLDVIWTGSQVSPAWLARAVGHHSEIQLFENARIEYAFTTDNGVWLKHAIACGNGLEGWRGLVKKMKANGSSLSVESLFFRTQQNITPEEDVLAVVLLDYLLQRRRHELIAFVTDSSVPTMDKRFEKAFRTSFEALAKDFWGWLEKLKT